MFEKIIESICTLLKSGESKKFITKSGEDLAKFCLDKDIESGVKGMSNTIQYIGSVKDILFWDKVQKWLEGIYLSDEIEVNIAKKFTEDEKEYKEYTKRQIQFIAEIDEEEKVIYYANLTRSLFLGYIDSPLYFKMAYLLKVFTLEEINYLNTHYSKEPIEKINFYIREFLLYGLADVKEIVNFGNNEYKYSELAEVFVECGIRFNDDGKLPFEKRTLEELKVSDPRSKMCWEE